MEKQPASKLQEFIEASKTKGASDEFLAALLIRRGWPPDDVYAALGEHWAAVTGLPVPERGRPVESAKEAFLYLLAFSTLCSWSTALGSAIFTFIDIWFPDPLSVDGGVNYLSSRLSVTWQMATIAVVFPIFLIVMRAIVKGNVARPEQPHSGVQRWLTYIALLGTAGTMMGDLIWFLNYLLSGEITARFFLKSTAVMVICGAIFLYYFRSLRSRKQQSTKKEGKWNLVFAVASTVAVVGVFLTGVIVAGTPKQIRHRQADFSRVGALRNLAYLIQAQRQKGINGGNAAELPATLTDVVKHAPVQTAQTRDPETQELYGYRVIGGMRYELCATFSAGTITQSLNYDGSVFWRHGAGRTCYALDASQAVP